jgi:hypothetical protein
VPTWKPHTLAKPQAEQLDVSPHTKVVAIVDLAGVPTGTQGKVLLANGFNWLRYRVLFENGVELSDLDGRHIAKASKRGR